MAKENTVEDERSFGTSNDDDFENLTILWLDAEVNTNEDNQNTQRHLRNMSNHVSTFEDQNECQKYIESVSSDVRLVLIVSGRLGREIVPHIHQLPQILYIYVYCADKNLNKQWAKSFNKVKAVITRLEELIIHIESCQNNSVLMQELQPTTSHTPTLSEPRHTTSHTLESRHITSDTHAQFFSIIHDPFDNPVAFIKCFIRMEINEADKSELISFYKDLYKNSGVDLNMIHKFQQNYLPAKAIWWYIRDSFLCRMLNNVVREQNIYLLFLFRSLIRDIHRQLKQYQCESPIRVYRGVALFHDEFDKLTASVGQFISINSFFATSLDRNIALSLTKNSPNHLKKVLFEITADPRVVTSNPFADVSFDSEHPSEREVLFMIGSIFHVNDIHCDCNQIWTVRMTLAPDDGQNWMKFFQQMEKVGQHDGKLTVLSFGKILREIGKVEQAEKYYYHLLPGISSHDSLLAHLYSELGEIASIKGDHNTSNQWHKRSLEIKMKADHEQSSNMNAHVESQKNSGAISMNTVSKLGMGDNRLNSNLRFTDIASEKHEILLPIEGYEKVPLVSLEEAVLPLVSVLPDIRRKVYVAKLRSRKPADGLTPDESAAIVLYTMEWEPQKECLYIVLNSALRTADRMVLKPWFFYLKLIFTALSRLPSIRRTVYRGVKLDLSAKYPEGEEFFWWGFSSCTITMKILNSDQFLGNSGTRTLFAVECVNGKDIRQHSYFKNENEILLLPAIQLKVISRLAIGPDVHIIQLKEIKPQFPFLQPII